MVLLVRVGLEILTYATVTFGLQIRLSVEVIMDTSALVTFLLAGLVTYSMIETNLATGTLPA